MFEKINTTFRSHIVAEQIVDKIRASNMRVGDKLAPEREMAKSMNVGRNTLREAIAMLQVAGVLEVRRSSGIFVASLPNEGAVLGRLKEAGFAGATDSQSAIDARIAMEPGVAILASKSATEEDWDTFNRYIEAMRLSAEKGDVDAYRKCDNELHKAIARSSRNDVVVSTLIPIIDTARQPLWNAIKRNIYNASVLGSSFDEHCRIIEAMRSGDEYFIFRAFRYHLERSKSRLVLDID